MFLDLKEAEPYERETEFLFTHYAHKINHDDDHDEIVFDHDEVSVMDRTGWTELMKIEKFNNHEWYQLLLNDISEESMLSNQTSVMISADTLIPIYDTENTIRAFHGEIKYAYTLKKPHQLTHDDSIRFTKFIETSGNNNQQFANIRAIPIYEDAVGYKIYTKSKFFNSGIFHMYGDNNHISQNIVYK
jgi:hypothetical protein